MYVASGKQTQRSFLILCASNTHTVFNLCFVVIDAILQLYLILFAILACFTELEWTGTVRNSILCQSWIFRGLIYMFIGTLAVKEDIPNDILVDTILGNINYFCGYVFVLFGGVYFVLGLLCIKRMRDRKMARYIALLAHNEVRHKIINMR